MSTPSISVITPSFNQGAFIRDAIESVLGQNYASVEHIVVDGGSTDETLDILRSYPHLRWTSRPDKGQSDALNTGFRRASGDIIAWLNSDDWYAPGAFSAIAAALQTYPVVMGQCQMTDRCGRPTGLVKNLEHSWSDILKYWVYDSIPTQPSIFFRRSVLEEVLLDDGSYLDPELDFCMDFDLWLRIARRYPFNVRLNQLLSYYRIYDTNKTGGDWALIFKEASRVFARHANRDLERRLTFVIELDGGILAASAILDALKYQSMSDFEVLLVGTPGGALGRSAVYELAARYPTLSLRFTMAGGVGWLNAVNHAVHVARAPVICPIRAGDQVLADLGMNMCKIFASDSVGLILAPDSKSPSIEDLTSMPSAEIVKYLVRCAPHCSLAAIRRVAAIDLGGIGDGPEAYAIARCGLRMLYKGWQLHFDGRPRVSPAHDVAQDGRAWDALSRHVMARLIIDLEAEYQREPFAEVRAAHGASVRFSEALLTSARRLMEHAPAGWLPGRDGMSDAGKRPGVDLEDHAPAWHSYASVLEARGESEQAAQAFARYRELEHRDRELFP